VKLSRYPESDRLKALDARLRGNDGKNSSTAELIIGSFHSSYILVHLTEVIPA